MAVGEYVKVATLEELPAGGMLGVEMPDGLKVCLVHTLDDEFYAIADRCTHRDFPMSNGSLHGGATIECAWHGARFDLKTGRALRLPAIKPVKTYEVVIEDGDVKLRI